MRSLFVLAAAATLVSSCTPLPSPPRTAQQEAELQKMLAGRVAGEPVDCLPSVSEGHMVVIDDGTILFRESGHRIWLNTMDGSRCSGISSGNVFVTERFGMSRLCRGDIARAMEPNSRMIVGSCRMGAFVPYTKP